MLNFDRSTVKHTTQDIQSDCYQSLTDSFRVHQIRFRSGLRPGPHWGSLQHSPDPLVGLMGPTSEAEERGREGPAPFRKFLDRPLYALGINRPWPK